MSNNSSLDTLLFRRELQQYIYNVNDILLYIQIFICIMGISGNILALIVINRKALKTSSSSVFITYMAIFDIAILLVHAAGLVKLRHNAFLHCTILYLQNLSTFCASWVLVIITLERCLAVHSPFLAKRFCTIDSARRSIYILLVVSVLFVSVPFPLIYEKRTSKCYFRTKATFIARIYQSILFYFLPDLFLLSNLFIVYTLCRRQRMSSTFITNGNKVEMHVNDVNSSRKQRQLTIMLVTVSLSFYLFTTPSQIFYIKQHERPTHRNLQKIKRDFLFRQISVILSQLNSATDFIFYCLAGKRFRQETIRTFYHYSRQLKLFYHRYILCNKQYHLKPHHHHQPPSHLGTNMITTRGAYCPTHQRRENRRSPI